MSEHDPGLDAIMRTDRFVDALASGARMSSVDPLSSMLGAWRDDVRGRPDTEVVTLAQASAALASVQKPRRRNRFGLTVAGAAAAAVLAIGGFGAAVYGAGPGDSLYGLRNMLFGESAKTRDDAVVLAAQTELAQVQQLVQQGRWDQAQERLVTLGPTVQSVNNVQSKQQLVETYNSLTAKVIQRNPEATPPPRGEPLPVNPSSPLTFLPVPAIVATTTTPRSNQVVTTTVPSSLPTTTGPLPTTTGALPTPTSTVLLPTPTSTVPLPTTTGPLPTTTGRLQTPTSTVPLPTPTSTGPLPTPTSTVLSPTPTSTVPLPTSSRPLPTSTGPLPTPTGPPPTPTTPPPPPISRTTVPTVVPTVPATVTTPAVQAPPSVPETVTRPAVPQPTAAPPAQPSQSPRAPDTQRPSIVVTTPVPAPQGPQPNGH